MDELVYEALKVVTLCKRLCIVHASGKTGNINTSEGVGFARVTTNAEDLWELGCVVEDIGIEILDGVLITDGALVPIVRDFLVTRVVSKVSRLAGNGEKALEHFLVEDALGVFGRLVPHETIDESGGGLRDKNAGEWAVEEVGILRD